MAEGKMGNMEYILGSTASFQDYFAYPKFINYTMCYSPIITKISIKELAKFRLNASMSFSDCPLS